MIGYSGITIGLRIVPDFMASSSLPIKCKAQCLEPLYYLLPAGTTELKIEFQPSDFTQVNPEINKRMVSNAIDYLDLKENISQSAKSYVNEAAKYFTLSQEVTHSHSSYFYKLGKINYNISTLNYYEKGICRWNSLGCGQTAVF